LLSGDDLKNILYFGWFTNGTTSSSLQDYTMEIFQKLYHEVPMVAEFMNAVVGAEGDPFNYFVKPLDPNTESFDPYYHVTAKFCGDTDCAEYYATAKSSLEKIFETNLIGFFFTKRTYGIRVNLTAEQEELFDFDTEKQDGTAPSSSSRLINKSDFPGIEFIPQPMNSQPSRSRAHITLGCAPEVLAVQTGLDLLDIIQYEFDEIDHDDEVIPSLGTLSLFHKENITKSAFVLYTEQKLLVDGKFEAYHSPASDVSNLQELPLLIFLVIPSLLCLVL